MSLVHATGVVRDGWAALLTGSSGAGKSDLALRLIDRGWRLLADDTVRLERSGDRLVANAPPATLGLIEVRGIGIVVAQAVASAPVALVIELGPEIERMPEQGTILLLDVTVARISLDPRPASVAIKVDHAFARVLAALNDPEA